MWWQRGTGAQGVALAARWLSIMLGGFGIAIAGPRDAPWPPPLTEPALASPTRQHLYVATTGDDDGPGSIAAPLRTMARAALLARADSTVHVAPGVYRERVTTRAVGRADAPIYYVSTSKWGAKIIGEDDGGAAIWINHGDYSNIIGFDISGAGRIGILNWASHSLMAGNHVHDLAVAGACPVSGGAGIDNAGYASADNDIIGNVVHDIGAPGACNSVHGIYSSNLRARIVDNLVYRASAWGIHLWHAANQVLIARNTVFANGARGIGGGILIGAGDSPGGVVLDHTDVVDNIVTDNPAASIEEYCYAGQACIGAHNIIADNIVRGNGKPVSLRVDSAPRGTNAAVGADQR